LAGYPIFFSATWCCYFRFRFKVPKKTFSFSKTKKSKLFDLIEFYILYYYNINYLGLLTGVSSKSWLTILFTSKLTTSISFSEAIKEVPAIELCAFSEIGEVTLYSTIISSTFRSMTSILFKEIPATNNKQNSF
jgi:hypothetical protein